MPPVPMRKNLCWAGPAGRKAERAEGGAERQCLAAGDESSHAVSSFKAGRQFFRQRCEIALEKRRFVHGRRRAEQRLTSFNARTKHGNSIR